MSEPSGNKGERSVRQTETDPLPFEHPVLVGTMWLVL